MDLHQSLPNSNSLTCSTLNSGHVSTPSDNQITSETTTSTIATTAAVENKPTATDSTRTSPTISLVNHHHQHRNSQNLVTQKTNQVSTVLLYNIPIVSLYIEGQERLCLAQISNTLLKQFSYNEIHNRRVALGITCVQCTPVQLEILRRAGAMPVSSRRCGMITRREAERLCKSFLGDNTPPRLPEDFAFNVQHKCSWGCRGSFLPSRYNSSRAKCIKCLYCGMFFSPNKFIFHSHRVGPGDKYVQPDAANFNSWRRHMMLSGQPPQEVIYAWEDVKAMFNGGTRKRLMISNSSSSPLPRVNSSSPSSCSAGASSSSLGRDQSLEDPNATVLLSNISKNENSLNAVTAAAAVVGVTAVAVGSTVRPLNLRIQSTTAKGLATESSYSVGGDMQLLPAAALSRSLMMDYMWQHAHQAAKNTYSQQYQPQSKLKSNNSAFTLPWINATIRPASDMQSVENQHPNLTYSSVNPTWTSSATTNITRNFSQIINTSAFKPVVQQQSPTKLTEMPSSKTRRRHSIVHFSSDEDEQNNNDSHLDDKKLSTESNEDDILVDIETTEDEKFNALTTTNTTRLFTTVGSENGDENSDKQTASDEDVIDVVHNDNEETVPEFADSLPSFAKIKNSSENERKLSIPNALTYPTVVQKGFREANKFYSIDHSNSENVPPPAVSFSPKSTSSSSNSRSSECFFVKAKNNYEAAAASNSSNKNISRSPDINEDQKTYLNQEKSNKCNRKRPCEKLNQTNDESILVNNENSDEDIRSDSGKKHPKKSIEPIVKDVQLIEALSQKYELTYYNSNTSCKNSYVVSNNNPISNNDLYNDNNNNNEFWQMARLCMQRPINCEQHQKHNSTQQQLTRLPTFYYRHQHLHSSPAEQHPQQNSHTTPLIPATQQVYLHLQHQQSVQKYQNSYSNEVIQPTAPISSNHTPIVYIPEPADVSISPSFSAYSNTQRNT